MKNQQRTKKHHFVPECYLKNFIKEGCLFTLDVRKVQKGFNTLCKEGQPAMICYLEDYYKIDSGSLNNQFQLDGYENLFIETDVLTSLEGKYGELWNKITMKQELTMDEAVNMCDFIIQMKLRNPYWFEYTLKKYKEAWIDSAMNSIYREKFMTNPRFAHIPENIQKLICEYVRDDNKNDVTFSKKMQLFGLIQRYSENPERNSNIEAKGVIEINNRSLQCVNKLLIASDDWYLSQIAVINNPNKTK
ncbi:MAG: hypothetical protein B7X86_06955 [Sphingobacteriales bacterium 17-39-43]|uniref:DUF4238 domain-containing protein n=1 Tax=Daejeonella sp. TaxID=2805397 RepID=UPI000BCC4F88|nr:DUF4238 domain-containing protein [Daejeonella sp.]OYZ31729.1 MAG: hypothetical protein B7Y24_07770 [Sphingobacteriales bacterium 16-39-50]OZA25125.1 MAG: hypothetical protein B7X86_06955 [Sphingobacteriales bacterium 17-39-43]HQT22884.1 DUF4238 domain-containing protein [Daejeonella sp.]HQT57007.1 DUF4238 domain-containing protein [Daejeonella sp.]